MDKKGEVLNNLNKPEEALKILNKSIELNPLDSEASINKGFALDKLKKYDEAIKAYDKVIELNPSNSLAWIKKEKFFII